MSKFLSYGVRERFDTENDIILQSVEEITNLGYSVINSGYTSSQIEEIAKCFDDTHEKYVDIYGKVFLEKRDELNTIRLPLAYEKVFFDVAFNPILLALAKFLIRGKFYLNQQNGIINPPKSYYNQGSFHRDLPYQHFTSSRPLAINALYCVDNFTNSNGGTIVIPSSHKLEQFPSDNFIENHASSIEAPAGSLIILDCMVFHKGGWNDTEKRRRAINNVYSIPLLKQQINIADALHSSSHLKLNHEQRDILGFNHTTASSIDDYLKSRDKGQPYE